ncbi:uncharacterized protein PHALS_04117 [Plasmopara halstedii]|uniref:Uncharacterized protein n=1 Tax=Plasmopara halstedii TaxID=4781 RepID=A0A0P1A9C1_PLAHL|nr:uncharacterized protein PHALS_04117 [Plasmopara halstedii]CEG36864.1 hypothetical protein PHALS_04117 [Plasmopara halstedii]|eukprot:XP_024573233.1 hypothetical protein PHALS_04117 [Plasmopara halstedii]
MGLESFNSCQRDEIVIHHYPSDMLLKEKENTLVSPSSRNVAVQERQQAAVQEQNFVKTGDF